ncbi:PrsW family glutamic-type intramembrane protease [Eubacterium pyruvativorans]|uniref:PrsW family glutamic-type intramembrane protease n=1 Tax=Eubacterium pyruvativorans TaxID=155865 RepID=UPI0023F39B46|nr:PrsW family glutamic-type intramembrane protease [Eubacterium pyruvativorans]MDD7684306.1 PrsW family glutamic-type intramembrane protease [Eubacterium pyruvativorans]
MFMFYAPAVLLSPMTILLLAALIPPFILLVKVYRMDTIEKEPKGLIFRLVLAGALTVIPAGFLEGIGIGSVLTPLVGKENIYLYNFLQYFLVVGIAEEGVKHFALRKITWSSPEFNYRFDAVVYAVSVSLGFAAAENISYVFSYGLSVALVRAVTSIPGHAIFGIYMGYYYGMARWARNRGNRAAGSHYMRMSMIVPVLLHGAYDFCASSRNSVLALCFYIYIILLDIAAFREVKKLSREDTYID